MLDPRLAEKMQKAYALIGDIGYQLALNIRKGKDFTPRQEALYDKGIKIWTFLKILFRHVDTTTTPPTLYLIKEEQANRLIECIEKIGELDRLPIVPKIIPSCKPIIINKGRDGRDGVDGINAGAGSIVVEPKLGEEKIKVDYVLIGQVEHFQLSFDEYVSPLLSVQVQGTKVYEIGVIVASKTINIVTTKGSVNILSVTMTDVDLNADLQGTLNLVTVNGVSQPVTNFVTDTDITSDVTYIANVNDGVNTIGDQDMIQFFYPLLYGANSNILTTTHYNVLSKVIVGKENVSIPFNDTDKYFYIGVPSSYGSFLVRDQNGFDVTSEFTEQILDVTSVGLDNNWVHEYRWMRTTVKTDIVNHSYSIEY